MFSVDSWVAVSFVYPICLFFAAPGSPTFRPTISTHSPTVIPTIDPYPVETLLIFNNTIRCDNIDSFTFYDDPRIEIAVVSAFASTMQNVTAEMVRVVNITDVAGARRLSTINSPTTDSAGSVQVNYPINKHTLSHGVTITMQVAVILETLGYTASQSNNLYTLLTSQASTDIVNNEFSTALADSLLTLGVASSITPVTDSYRAHTYSMSVLQTAKPSVAPTLSPTIVDIPLTENSQGTITTVDIIVIVTVIGSVAILLGLLYGAYYEKEKIKQIKLKVAPLTGASATSIVPGP